MDTTGLEQLRARLHASLLSLVQPVVRGDTLYVGQHVSLTEEGSIQDPFQGRPLRDCVDASSREQLVDRYHLSSGGVVGTPPGRTRYKARGGLQPIPPSHLLAFALRANPAHRSTDLFGTWLVLDGHTLGFVLAAGPRISRQRRADVLPDLQVLRRRLARQFDEMSLHLQRTGLVILDEDNHVLAADPQGEAFTRASHGKPPRPGISRGVMVASQTVAGSQGGTVATVRPIHKPVAPVGLLLTATERQILPHLITGATLAEIASSRACSRPTVERHRDNIYAALGASRRVEIAERLHDI